MSDKDIPGPFEVCQVANGYMVRQASRYHADSLDRVYVFQTWAALREWLSKNLTHRAVKIAGD